MSEYKHISLEEYKAAQDIALVLRLQSWGQTMADEDKAALKKADDTVALYEQQQSDRQKIMAWLAEQNAI
jgi:hypothetical protein